MLLTSAVCAMTACHDRVRTGTRRRDADPIGDYDRRPATEKSFSGPRIASVTFLLTTCASSGSVSRYAFVP